MYIGMEKETMELMVEKETMVLIVQEMKEEC